MKKVRIILLYLLLAIAATACGKEKKITAPENLYGKINFYKEPVPEGQHPLETEEVVLSTEKAGKIWSFLQGISKEKWTDDTLPDRISFTFDGELRISGWQGPVYFSYSSNIVYSGHSFATIDVGEMQYLRDINPGKVTGDQGLNSKVAYAGYASRAYIDRVVQTGQDGHVVGNAIADGEQHEQLPLFMFESASDLSGFMKNYSDVFRLNCSYSEVPSFADATRHYTQAFFNDHALIAVYVPTNSGSYRYGVKNVHYDEQGFSLYIEQVNRPIICDDDMTGWFVLLEVKKTDIAHCTRFNALL